ncbi:hypothetical protein C8034_v006818 [Colletotrichum sidae]|uniref:Secreted protein n=4 Tax=Colletotrichum orbiculare species complex TaxID=2707354 RepID=N4UR14_COLOR|nr:hypothetical protein Cob_v008925 [Colletotrichum orbiculare MAFF 240422]TDZ31564.1 hypothetical protein C8035_v001500 [Colletotrichum spinosum]TDZ46932.1 hypothetical protein CTRI78_v008826 [Colletotrichum trifolii]TEA11972.1 hypothetical protein C8034_v006818 [Colletotrichum sidae]
MQFPWAIILAATAASATPGSGHDMASGPVARALAKRQGWSDCSPSGVVNGQCARVYNGENCKGKTVWQIKPNCDQFCNKVGAEAIYSISASGDGTYGTTCYIYEDDDCKKEIGKTANRVGAGQSCASNPTQTIKSWKCTFKC